MAKTVVDRWREWQSNGNAQERWLNTSTAGDRIVVSTGKSYTSQRRIAALMTAAGCAAAGVVFAFMVPWASAAAIVGIAGSLIAFKRIRPRPLLEIDSARRIVVIPDSKTVDGETLIAVAGRYETQGWDPRSVIVGIERDGSERQLAVFTGTDERLAEYACRVLGMLLDVPSTYRGTEGRTVTCYQPSLRT